MPTLTLRSALELPEFRRGSPEVVAGAAGLDREIRWVHAGEVSNIAAMLKGGELLLTTGMGIGRREADQRRYARDLSERGVCGLAVELGTVYADRLPAPLVDEAERHGLPLVALHRELPFVELTEALHRAIVDRQAVLAAHGDEVQRRLTDLVLDGGGVREILAGLAEIVANPVVLDRDGLGVVAHASHGSPDSTVLAAWESMERGKPQTEHVVAEVRTGRGGRWGRLAALATQTELTDRDRVALEHAVTVLAVALRGRHEETLVARRRGDFLDALMQGSVDDSEAAAGALAVGFARHTHRLLAVVAVSPAGDPGAGERAGALAARDLVGELEAAGMPALAGPGATGTMLLVVVGLREDAQRADAASAVADGIRSALARHAPGRRPAVVCVGATVGSWEQVGDALREAADVAIAARSQPERPWHDVLRPDLDQLLHALRDSRALVRFAERRLAPLVEHDRTRTPKLLPTLAAYCAHGAHKASAARALHLDRKSLYHRLRRIEELLGVDLSDAEQLLELHLAVRAREHMRRASGP